MEFLLALAAGPFERAKAPPPTGPFALTRRWRSKALLEYWRRIESILPIFITGSFADSRISILQSSMDSFERRYR